MKFMIALTVLAVVAVCSAHHPTDKQLHEKKAEHHDTHHVKSHEKTAHHTKPIVDRSGIGYDRHPEPHYVKHSPKPHADHASPEPHYVKHSPKPHADHASPEPHYVKHSPAHVIPFVPPTGAADQKCDCATILAIRCEVKRLRQKIHRLKNINHQHVKHGGEKIIHADVGAPKYYHTPALPQFHTPIVPIPVNPVPIPSTPVVDPVPVPSTPVVDPVPVPSTPVVDPVPVPAQPEPVPAPPTPIEAPAVPPTPIETPPALPPTPIETPAVQPTPVETPPVVDGPPVIIGNPYA
jgi:hypothetical protein